MHKISMNEVSPDFAECWQAADGHGQQQGQWRGHRMFIRDEGLAPGNGVGQ